MIDTIYLANAIANFAEGSTRVEEFKATTSKEMTTMLIVSNKTINKCNNDILFKITQLEIEARREAIASQERTAAMFVAILPKGNAPS